MSQPLSSMMSGLTLDSKQQAASSSRQQQQGERLAPVLKKYMNKDIVRPANTGLSASASGNTISQEQRRIALMKLAGHNTADGVPGKLAGGSPSSKGKISINQHTAHGLHGPAHATSSRALSGKIEPYHPTHPSAAAAKNGIGKYDGGLEADAEGKEIVTGESAKLLEMQSA